MNLLSVWYNKMNMKELIRTFYKLALVDNCIFHHLKLHFSLNREKKHKIDSLWILNTV
jgi:hypothetical protein